MTQPAERTIKKRNVNLISILILVCNLLYSFFISYLLLIQLSVYLEVYTSLDTAFMLIPMIIFLSVGIGVNGRLYYRFYEKYCGINATILYMINMFITVTPYLRLFLYGTLFV